MSEFSKQINDAIRAKGIASVTATAAPKNQAMNDWLRQAAPPTQQVTAPQDAPEAPQQPVTPPGNAGTGTGAQPYSEPPTSAQRMNHVLRSARWGNSGGGGRYTETGKQV